MQQCRDYFLQQKLAVNMVKINKILAEVEINIFEKNVV